MKDTIMIDIDGVMRNMAIKAIQTYQCFYDPHTKLTHDDITAYDFRNVMPMIKDLGEFFIQHANNLFYEAPPYPGAIEFVKDLKKDGYNISIVTHQLKETERYTLGWITEHHMPYDSIHFSKDKSMVKGKLLIDDCVDNLEKCVNNSLVVCLNQPWNQDWKGDRVNSYDELGTYVRNLDKTR